MNKYKIRIICLNHKKQNEPLKATRKSDSESSGIESGLSERN